MYNNLWLVNGHFQPYITSFTTIREPGFKPWMCLKMGYTSNYSHVNSSKTGTWPVIGGMPHFQEKKHIGYKLEVYFHIKPTFSKKWWYQTSIPNPHSQNDDDIKPPYQTHILKMMMISNSISNPHSQNDDDIKPPYQSHVLKLEVYLHIKPTFPMLNVGYWR
jgi:hypothetical protein